MRVGDLIVFAQEHREKPGLDYTDGWTGIIMEKVLDSFGELERLHILWGNGKISEYPSSWWNELSYEPFEVINDVG